MLLLVLFKADLASTAHVKTTWGQLAIEVGGERLIRWDWLIWCLTALPVVLVFLIAGESRRSEFWQDPT